MTKRTSICGALLCIVLCGEPFKADQKVILKVPTGYEKWLLSVTCTNAWLLATDFNFRASVEHKIRAGGFVMYSPNTQAVIEDVDEDGYCNYVKTVPDGTAGWVYVGLTELTTAEKKKVAAEMKSAEEKRQAERRRAEEKRQAEQRLAEEERRRAAAERQTEQRRLESLPRLVGPAPNVIVSVDEGCLKDVQKLKGLGGVELRKRIAELLGYQCVFTVPSGTHVTAIKNGDSSYSIVVMEGPEKGKAGVVGSESIQR